MPAHKLGVIFAAIQDCGSKSVEHPPYLSNLASSDF